MHTTSQPKERIVTVADRWMDPWFLDLEAGEAEPRRAKQLRSVRQAHGLGRRKRREEEVVWGGIETRRSAGRRARGYIVETTKG